MTKKERKAHEERMNYLLSEARAVVASGKCPVCGAGLHENLSILGWFQCDRSGSADFRRDKTGESCNFQCFTR